jgi:hypothetical protein
MERENRLAPVTQQQIDAAGGIAARRRQGLVMAAVAIPPHLAKGPEPLKCLSSQPSAASNQQQVQFIPIGDAVAGVRSVVDHGHRLLRAAMPHGEDAGQ